MPANKPDDRFKTLISFERDAATLVVGPPSSGKTTLLRKAIEHGEWSDGGPQRLFVIAPPVSAPSWKAWKSPYPMTIKSSMDEVKIFLAHANEVPMSSIVIFDDYMALLNKEETRRPVEEWMYMTTHHRHLWTFFVAHNMFKDNMVTVRRNTHNFILFDTLSSDAAASKGFITKLFGAETAPLMMTLWEQAIRDSPNGFVRIDQKLRAAGPLRRVVSTGGVTLDDVWFATRSDDNGETQHLDAFITRTYVPDAASEQTTLVKPNHVVNGPDRGQDEATADGVSADGSGDVLEHDERDPISE